MPMNALNRKLLRDLWRIRGQACAIADVIGVGVLLLVMMSGLVTSLDETRRAYYQQYRFADLFAPVKRAPNLLLERLAAIPGVTRVDGRVVGRALVDLPGSDVPFQARALSRPVAGGTPLNDLCLTAGRFQLSDQAGEILLLDSFAAAHQLTPGDSLLVTMNGVRQRLSIVGLARAPEFLYATAPGELMSDASRYAVIWASRSLMEAVYDMDGAFNEALVAFGVQARKAEIVRAVDRLLEPYGGLGAYGRAEHSSNRFISDEIDGLRATSRSVPPIFLAVAAFLLYIVVSRIVQAEREQIGLLKAFGYTDLEVGLHYFRMILSIAIVGALFGCLAGIAAGRALIHLYLEYFKFPFLLFQLNPGSFITAVLVSVGAASAGGLLILRRVFLLAPAAAMRPPAPTDYSRLGGFGRRLAAILDQPCRMVLRRFLRQPVRMLGAIVGIAAGMALAVAMAGILAGFERMLALNFDVIDRSDVTVSFSEPLSGRALYELQSLSGVIKAEPLRTVPVVFRHGLNSYRGAITALAAGAQLNRAVDKDMTSIRLPQQGLVLARPLAEILAARPGDLVGVEVREGRREQLQIPVAAVAETLLGAPAFMDLRAISRALGEAERISAAHLRIDSARSGEIYNRLKRMPAVVGVSLKRDARAALQKQMDSSTGATRFIMAAIAAVIAFGVVYSAARIAYAEQAHDLAVLRVVGFSRGETTFVLLGELALVVVLALPVGALLGYHLTAVIAAAYSTDLYQIPLYFSPASYATAALVILASAVFSGWLVQRDMENVDLVSALKTSE